MPPRVIPDGAVAGHLIDRRTEEEDAVFADLPRHLDRGAVTCADGQRAVHHELHVVVPLAL